MLIVALVLAVVGLAALVTAVVTSNELVAWVCIAASVLGVILLIVDAIRERQHGGPDAAAPEPEPADEPAIAYSDEDVVESTYSTFDADYPADDLAEEQHPDEVVSEDPESDMPSDDEPELPEPAEEAAVHPVETADEPDEPDVTEDTDRR